MNKINKFLRTFVNKKNIKNLKNKDFSLIASNCNGVFILHDLRLKFLTPTINLWIKPDEYIEFLTNLKHYINSELEFIDEEEEEKGYPVGILDKKVRLYFQHYKTRGEAKEKWISRSQRINYDNLFILFTDRDGCTYDNLLAFDKLPYKNKIVFTNKKYPEIKSSFYIKGFEDQSSVGGCFEFRNKFTGIKYYDDFPYVKWFNGEI